MTMTQRARGIHPQRATPAGKNVDQTPEKATVHFTPIRHTLPSTLRRTDAAISFPPFVLAIKTVVITVAVPRSWESRVSAARKQQRSNRVEDARNVGLPNGNRSRGSFYQGRETGRTRWDHSIGSRSRPLLSRLAFNCSLQRSRPD